MCVRRKKVQAVTSLTLSLEYYGKLQWSKNNMPFAYIWILSGIDRYVNNGLICAYSSSSNFFLRKPPSEVKRWQNKENINWITFSGITNNRKTTTIIVRINRRNEPKPTRKKKRRRRIKSKHLLIINKVKQTKCFQFSLHIQRREWLKGQGIVERLIWYLRIWQSVMGKNGMKIIYHIHVRAFCAYYKVD